MDTYEATKIVLSRIQSLDPEHATRITGYILIQDQGEKEMIRLAFSPESTLLTYVSTAKAYLGLPSNGCSTPSPGSTPSSPSPFSTAHGLNHVGVSRPGPFSQSSPRIIIPSNNRFHNPPSPSSPWSSRSSRSAASYAAVVNGSTNTASGSSSSSLSLPFFNGNGNADELGSNMQVQDHLSFLEDSMDPIVSPSGRSDSVLFPYDDNHHRHHELHHRRSCSVNDAFLGGGGGAEEGGGGGNGGFGWRPCLYYARGFCKNGTSCKFLHGGEPEVAGPMVGSPDGFDELLRLKAMQQQQRIAAAQQLMASGVPPAFAFNKCFNFSNESPRSAAHLMNEELQIFGRCRPDRSDFAAMGLGGANSASRQIYLTFPADSTFKEEDVSNYFSMFGPVQDVRIPYQQKRMFGFVTFVYPETVKLILAKGNPHFVCDSRVLVKPYKEKGKVPDKKQHQQPPHMERGEFSGCLSPDSRDPFDLPFGARMFLTQEMMLRRKLEHEAELQQALELQGRRLMNMQLMDLKNHHIAHQFHPGMYPGSGLSSPSLAQSQTEDNISPPDREIFEGLNGNVEAVNPPPDVNFEEAPDQTSEALSNGTDSDSNKEESSKVADADPEVNDSLENILPDNLFASPTKSAAELQSAFASVDSSSPISTSPSPPNFIPMMPPASTLSMASLKSCYFQMPRFSSGQEAAET